MIDRLINDVDVEGYTNLDLWRQRRTDETETTASSGTPFSKPPWQPEPDPARRDQWFANVIPRVHRHSLSIAYREEGALTINPLLPPPPEVGRSRPFNLMVHRPGSHNRLAWLGSGIGDILVVCLICGVRSIMSTRQLPSWRFTALLLFCVRRLTRLLSPLSTGVPTRKIAGDRKMADELAQALGGVLVATDEPIRSGWVGNVYIATSDLIPEPCTRADRNRASFVWGGGDC